MGLNLKSVMFVLVMVGAIIGTPLMVEAQLGILNSLFGLTRITGTIFCTGNGNIGINGTSTPTFPNATVQLKCGNGNIVSTTTTNDVGAFSMLLNPIQFLLSALLNSCNLVVATPLSNCNAALPSVGSLISSLKLIGNIVEGFVKITELAPMEFQSLPPL